MPVPPNDMSANHLPHPPEEQRDFVFTDRDFQRVRRMIHARAGIALAPAKRDMVYGRLSRRLRALGLEQFGTYLDMLESDPSGDEWQSFTNALTTNLTAFFREPHHFEHLHGQLRRWPPPAARSGSGRAPPPPARSPTPWRSPPARPSAA